MKIGVFDSGIGGLSVAKAVEEAMPHDTIIFKNDQEHLPYGTKSLQQIYDYCLPVLQSLETEGCEVIVVACNTVSTNLITELRSVIQVPLVAVEPMIKPASELTKTGTVIVCATPRTLESKRYNELKAKYAKDIHVVEPDCSTWTSLIEKNEINDTVLHEALDVGLQMGADVIVLGCTHYHWIQKEIVKLAGKGIAVLQPEIAVVTQLMRVVKQLG